MKSEVLEEIVEWLNIPNAIFKQLIPNIPINCIGSIDQTIHYIVKNITTTKVEKEKYIKFLKMNFENKKWSDLDEIVWLLLEVFNGSFPIMLMYAMFMAYKAEITIENNKSNN